MHRLSHILTRHGRAFTEFRTTRYFPALDGLRAVSILLVVALHTEDRMWMALHGTIGVTIFFVISGWLITSLLLREESDRGHVHLGKFYLRRAFRLLPVYFTVLGVFAVLIIGLRMQWGHDAFVAGLPYYLTYQNDLAATSMFGHTWSLAIEEKFYVGWPLIAFGAVLTRRFRLPILTLLLAVTLAAEHSHVVSVYYLATYTPLLLGCLLALLMHTERTYRWVGHLTHPAVTLALVAAAAAQALLRESVHGHVHTRFSLLTVLAMPGILVGSRRLAGILSSRPFVHIGTRSYSLYLVHPLVVPVVGYVLAPGSTSRRVEIIHFALVLALSLIAAEVLYRFVERPLIAVGRRLMQARRGFTAVAAAPLAVVEDA